MSFNMTLKVLNIFRAPFIQCSVYFIFHFIFSFLPMVAPQSRTDLQGAMLKYTKKYLIKIIFKN